MIPASFGANFDYWNFTYEKRDLQFMKCCLPILSNSGNAETSVEAFRGGKFYRTVMENNNGRTCNISPSAFQYLLTQGQIRRNQNASAKSKDDEGDGCGVRKSSAQRKPVLPKFRTHWGAENLQSTLLGMKVLICWWKILMFYCRSESA